MSDVFEQDRKSNRRALIGLGGVLMLLALAIVAWLLFFRDDAAQSVDSEDSAAARQETLDEAAGQQPDADNPVDTAVEQAQPDAGASSDISGMWTIDTSIGTFDQDCLENVCGASYVGFRIDEELAGIGAKTVVGRTPGVAGSIEIDGTTITTASFTADMTQLITDDPGRNAAIKGATGGLETQKYPEASFVLTQPIELGEAPPEGAPIEVQATGDLTVHGVTREVTIPMTAELQAGLAVVFGTLPDLVLSDYDIPKPTAIVVLSVEDTADLELQLFLRR